MHPFTTVARDNLTAAADLHDRYLHRKTYAWLQITAGESLAV